MEIANFFPGTVQQSRAKNLKKKIIKGKKDISLFVFKQTLMADYEHQNG